MEYWITRIILMLKVDFNIDAVSLLLIAFGLFVFILFRDKTLRFEKLTKLSIVAAGFILLIIGALVLNWLVVDKAPKKTELLIPDYSAGTFGFRAWGTKIELSNIEISKIKESSKLFGSSIKWAKVWHDKHSEPSSDRYALINNKNEIFLKNCGLVYATAPDEFKFIKIEAIVKIIEVEANVNWPSFQFCFRVPAVRNKFTTTQQIQEINGHSERYIALEVHPNSIWYSKCWLADTKRMPKHEDDFNQRFLGILDRGIFKLKLGQPYRFVAELMDQGFAYINLIDSENITIPLYEGKLDSGKK